jgi:hypothetical protein
MEKKVDSKKKIANIAIVLIVIAGLMLAGHLLVNYFNIADVIKGIHGG